MGLDFNVEGENNNSPNIEPLLDWEKSLNSHLAEVIVNTETQSERPGDGTILEQTLTLEKSQNH